MLMKEIADALRCAAGDGMLEISRIVHPDAAEQPADLAVAMTAESAAALEHTKAQAVVASAKRAPPRIASAPSSSSSSLAMRSLR